MPDVCHVREDIPNSSGIPLVRIFTILSDAVTSVTFKDVCRWPRNFHFLKNDGDCICAFAFHGKIIDHPDRGSGVFVGHKVVPVIGITHVPIRRVAIHIFATFGSYSCRRPDLTRNISCIHLI